MTRRDVIESAGAMVVGSVTFTPYDNSSAIVPMGKDVRQREQAKLATSKLQRELEHRGVQFAQSDQAYEKLRWPDGRTENCYMRTFAGDWFKQEGEPIPAHVFKKTFSSALAFHLAALRVQLLSEIQGMQTPLIFWRMAADVHEDGDSYVLISRFGVIDLKGEKLSVRQKDQSL